MTSSKLSRVEILVLCAVAVLVALGFIFVWTSTPRFEQYIREDGIVEWLTVFGLLAASFVCIYRVVNKPRNATALFLLTSLVLGLLLFIAAGEEISWGQRIFGLQTPEYFREKNLQSETNFHNLKVNGIEINRFVFSYLLITALVIYLVIFPLLYKRKQWMKTFADRWGIPIPQGYQVLSFALVFALTALSPNGKRAELLECGGALLFFLIVKYPANPLVFRRQDVVD
jgi:cell division protein FtsW (lipid II flippase)